LPVIEVWLSEAIVVLLLPAPTCGVGWVGRPAGGASARATAAPRGAHHGGDAVVPAGEADQRAGFVLADQGDGGSGAERQGGLALLHGVVADRVELVGALAEVGVEPVEGVLGVDRGKRPLQAADAVGLGRVV
jgi:hypothetical protein